MIKRWSIKQMPAEEQVAGLSKSINVNRYLASILVQRGITDFETARSFFRPSLESLHSPFEMKGMNDAVERLQSAIELNEKLLIFGDYDVDGTTAVALVSSYLRRFYSCEVYIPDRNVEGYGISKAGIDWAADNHCTLIIALDCGIKSASLVEYAKSKGIDFIICDHHLPDHDIPEAIAVLDPKQEDCPYPYKELSGCGIGFKFMQAYAQRYRDPSEVLDFLDLVAVSIASDIVPLTGENRVLAYYGLRKLNTNPVPGLKALKDIADLRTELDVTGIVFSLGPRINAAGRIAHGSAAVSLLNAHTEEEANNLATTLNLRNEERKEYDHSITGEAIAMIEGSESLRSAKSTVLFKNTWHKGVIGIVAARCVEKYYRPTVILTESNNKITGSARSVNGFDLYNAILECSDLLEKFGGHKYAAGLTLDISNLELFQQKFEQVVSSTITEEMLTPLVEMDVSIPFDIITPKFMSILKQMSPFGPENAKPVFEASNVYVFNSLSSFKDRHIKFLAGQDNSNNVFQAVGFDLGQHYEKLAEADRFRMAFTLEENVYNGVTTIQLRIKDIKF
ncbi:single-stranded-DNA-specific exonuclease RecJ [Chryseolinea sp. T2]|uniref:single-stranded-DNA-specific exonuclease RecJ n=1 Tax=Chryseolinea sp. T2 TaxID=3129255 RepID=UPI0030782DC4